MDIYKLMLSSIKSTYREAQKQPVVGGLIHYRHCPNISPFTLDLSPKTFKDSDVFIKESKKDAEQALRANYKYGKG